MSSHLARPLLVVDENAQMRSLLSSILSHAGLGRVTPAAGVEEAKHLVRLHAPRAVITDGRVGEEDGLGLVEWLRRDPESPAADTPAIVLTGLAKREAVLRARDVGAHAILAKPVSMEALVKTRGPPDPLFSGGR